MTSFIDLRGSNLKNKGSGLSDKEKTREGMGAMRNNQISNRSVADRQQLAPEITCFILNLNSLIKSKLTKSIEA